MFGQVFAFGRQNDVRLGDDRPDNEDRGGVPRHAQVVGTEPDVAPAHGEPVERQPKVRHRVALGREDGARARLERGRDGLDLGARLAGLEDATDRVRERVDPRGDTRAHHVEHGIAAERGAQDEERAEG